MVGVGVRLNKSMIAILDVLCFLWQALNDKHNRGGVASEQEFAAFFDKRVYNKKANRPNYGLVLHHLQEAWIGTHAIVKKENWRVVACKLKHLFMLIEKYCKRILGQGDREASNPESTRGARQNRGELVHRHYHLGFAGD